MPASHDIQLIVFDLGGVIVRTCADWEEAFRRTSVTPTAKAQQLLRGGALLEFGSDFESGRVTAEQFTATVAQNTGLSPGDVLKLIEAWLVEPQPGVEDMIDRIKQAGMPTACLSNTNICHWHRMTRHATFTAVQKLDRLFASFEIGVMKPDARIYAHVEQALNVTPGQVLFFDDNLANCEGARDRGWNVHRITSLDPASQMQAHLRELGILS